LQSINILKAYIIGFLENKISVIQALRTSRTGSRCHNSYCCCYCRCRNVMCWPAQSWNSIF